METQPQDYSLIRRILFPYSGNEQLTPRQRLRVITIWALFFTIPMLLCTVLMGLAAKTNTSKLLIILGIVLVAGMVLFGATAAFAVSTNNRSVRKRQQSKDRADNTSGGRYGS
ncbi:hypothetical protein [Ktedonospora formicarum]|uniref:Uncharacterized protein n=1 Tax=Ktedonospora formicarum TaxID=2778364 RepID=A0A8J3HZQ5_9CHLR|nr:hypothetical protein [Ktedonospora formicarum]GHO44100.1 hypothetical protein KSX_22630 [Ktedonospora formicarum]